MTEIRVLAVRQPWASLIVEGLKTIEVRSRVTNIREVIAIYASASKQDEIEEYYREYNFYTLPKGVIIGTVEIIGCADFDLITFSGKELLSKASCLPSYKISTNFYYWKLANPVKFFSPIPYKPPKGAVVWSKTDLLDSMVTT
jgi:hypothetical protein